MLKLCRNETFEAVKAMGKSFEDNFISLKLRYHFFADERQWILVLQASAYSGALLACTMVDPKTFSWGINISYVSVRGFFGPFSGRGVYHITVS